MVRTDDFDPSVPLPPGLSIPMIRKAVDYIEEELVDFVDLYLEQANVFSALVGIFGTRALDSFSNFEKHRHAYTAQQRFPDLCRRSAKKPLSPNDCLESKGSKRPFSQKDRLEVRKEQGGGLGWWRNSHVRSASTIAETFREGCV